MIGSGVSFPKRLPAPEGESEARAALRVWRGEGAAGVGGLGARRHLAEGDDLGDRLAAVFVGDVADHPLAAADREVDVDIPHRLTTGGEEALEDQAFGERVEVGD